VSYQQKPFWIFNKDFYLHSCISIVLHDWLVCTRAGSQLFSQYRRSNVWLFILLIVQNHGCLPFTWANRSVHGLDKWWEQFWTGNDFVLKQRLPCCTSQFHLLKNSLHYRPETGIKDGFEETRTRRQVRLKNSVLKNRTTLSDMPLLPEIFR